jgi:prepilin-type processing-associated H-X9-DG protein
MTTDTRYSPTVKDYTDAFEKERAQQYPVIDAFEKRMGYSLDRARLESAARTLACPLKVHPPNWQHGRVLYAAARRYLSYSTGQFTLLDIGTAKGFSALCLKWAVNDAGVDGHVVTVDVIDPFARIYRNSVADLDGLKTLAELLRPWPESGVIEAVKTGGVQWLKTHPGRVHFAFVDGKHTGSVVAQEGQLLADRQEPGDVVIFDDVHLPDILEAVHGLDAYFFVDILQVLPARAYAMGVRL